MFDGLAAAIEELPSFVDGDSLAELLALRDRLDARIAAAASEFDTRQLWELDGAPSLDTWLETRGQQTKPAAKQLARTVNRLRSLPVVSAAWQAGSLCGAQVDT